MHTNKFAGALSSPWLKPGTPRAQDRWYWEAQQLMERIDAASNGGTGAELDAQLRVRSAAPELLAACKAFLHANNEKRYSAKETLEAREMMEAAVAKAEGRDEPTK